MKISGHLNGILLISMGIGMLPATAADPLALEIRARNGQWEVSWPATLACP